MTGSARLFLILIGMAFGALLFVQCSYREAPVIMDDEPVRLIARDPLDCAFEWTEDGQMVGMDCEVNE